MLVHDPENFFIGKNPVNFRGDIIRVLAPVILCVWTGSVLGEPPNQRDFHRLAEELQHDFGDSFGFSVLVASGSGVVFDGAYGFIDSTRMKRVDENTLFNIASISKSITAMEVMRLMEQHRISLSDSIGKYVGHVPDDKRSITISDLLSHASGFEQNYVCDGLQTPDAALKALLGDTLSFTPGSGFRYSNENYEMLAIIIEKITGRRYEDVMRDEILDPLEMYETCFWNEVSDKDNVAGMVEEIPDSLFRRNWGYIGSGGLFSTPTDLYKFWKAVRDHKLISAASTEMVFKSTYRTSSGIDIGHGWFVNDSTDWNSREIWTRGSESWGHNAVIRWFPERKAVIIVCTNSGELGDKQETGNRIVSKFIADWLWK